MKKEFSLVMVFFLFLASSNLMAKEQRGMILITQKTENQEKSGELMTVKQNALLPFDEIRAVPIEDVKEIPNNLKSQNKTGFVSGLVSYAFLWIWTNSQIF
ncbi:MAG: hypothetical protein GTO17_10710 [Candidatus Aminicenantes bacterium]|nr:hypothetical protein [Candidatus Aminicenantes bacterium]